MKKIKESILLKLLCFILIPIFIIVLLVSIAGAIISTEYGDTNDNVGKSYIESENFGENYLISVISDVSNVKNYIRFSSNQIKGNVNSYYFPYNQIEVEGYDKKVYYKSPEYYSSSIYNYINYILIDENTGNLYTNIKLKDYEKEMEEIKNKKIYWSYENKTITSTIETINQDNAKYMILPYYSLDELEGITVYSYLEEKAINASTVFNIQQKIYEIFQKAPNAPTYLTPITAIGLVIMVIYLCWAIGYEKGRNHIELNRMDKLSYEILFMLAFFIVAILVSLVAVCIESKIPGRILSSIMIISYVGSYASISVLFTSTIKRIKAKEFWHTFLIYRIYTWIKNGIKDILEKMSDKTNLNKKIIFFYTIFILISVILISMANTFIGFILLIAFWIWVLYEIIKYFKKVKNIENVLKEIYQGNADVHLEEEELTGVLKRMAKYINDIAGGFSNAIDQSLKSERLKTELITNVSHDIKTPLTSIINYVDLLKKEEIKDAKIEQYIAILDTKSQRLKKLIEDLVEASKVSSGNVKLNIEVINLKELLNQAIGEFEDKFEKKNLKIDLNIPKEDIKIQADNRYMYRIIENLFSNITKYAMENTRIYIQLQKLSNEIELEIKNISASKLNISSDELMQRFVRGDKSRYTEGSGLGLSIAKSLTEIQGGRFNISIDGDLFKVVLKWNHTT